MAALLIDGVFQLLYQGSVIDSVADPDRKGQAAFTECTTTPTSEYQETGRATKVDVKKNDDGKFEGTSNFLQLSSEVDEIVADTGHARGPTSGSPPRILASRAVPRCPRPRPCKRKELSPGDVPSVRIGLVGAVASAPRAPVSESG